jgi:branched-subunit amino acid transport protein AzlD
MTTRAVRAFIAIAVVGVFMLITGFMALFPLITKAQVDLNQYADFFAKTASVYTGIIGVIVGYYFATVEGTSSKKTGPPPSAEGSREEG